MKIKILTLFPEMFQGIFEESILKRAIDKGVCSVELIDMRAYSLEKHHHVDDTPYGGGAGMVIACDVVDRALDANASPNALKVLLTPQGKPYQDSIARAFAEQEELVLICGHYEGFDERVRSFVDEEISIGDFVLTGGEPAAMVICDSVIRLLDHAIKTESHEDDSFANGLLEYPQYTRPKEYKQMSVPEVLINGNHKDIMHFRKKEALRKTYLRRRDLLKAYPYSLEEEEMLKEIISEEKNSSVLEEMLEKSRPMFYQKAHPLILTLWQYYFEAGSKEAIYQVLSYGCTDRFTKMKVIHALQPENKRHPVIRSILNDLAIKNKHNGFEIESGKESNEILYGIAFILDYANPISKLYMEASDYASKYLPLIVQKKLDGLEGCFYLYDIMKQKNILASLEMPLKQVLQEKWNNELQKNSFKTCLKLADLAFDWGSIFQKPLKEALKKIECSKEEWNPERALQYLVFYQTYEFLLDSD